MKEIAMLNHKKHKKKFHELKVGTFFIVWEDCEPYLNVKLSSREVYKFEVNRLQSYEYDDKVYELKSIFIKMNAHKKCKRRNNSLKFSTYQFDRNFYKKYEDIPCGELFVRTTHNIFGFSEEGNEEIYLKISNEKCFELTNSTFIKVEKDEYLYQLDNAEITVKF